MQSVFSVDGLWGIQKILTELVAEVNVDFIETALVVTEPCEVLIDVLPLAVLLVCFLLEVAKEVALHFLFIKEVVSFIDNGLKATASKCFCLLTHTFVIVLLALVLGFGIDVNAEGFMAHDLHRTLVPVAWIVVEIEGKLFSALDFPCAEGHGLADVTHTCIFKMLVIKVRCLLTGAKERNEEMLIPIIYDNR